jgi:hypothetical protein
MEVLYRSPRKEILYEDPPPPLTADQRAEENDRKFRELVHLYKAFPSVLQSDNLRAFDKYQLQLWDNKIYDGPIPKIVHYTDPDEENPEIYYSIDSLDSLNARNLDALKKRYKEIVEGLSAAFKHAMAALQTSYDNWFVSSKHLANLIDNLVYRAYHTPLHEYSNAREHELLNMASALQKEAAAVQARIKGTDPTPADVQYLLEKLVTATEKASAAVASKDFVSLDYANFHLAGLLAALAAKPFDRARYTVIIQSANAMLEQTGTLLEQLNTVISGAYNELAWANVDKFITSINCFNVQEDEINKKYATLPRNLNIKDLLTRVNASLHSPELRGYYDELQKAVVDQYETLLNKAPDVFGYLALVRYWIYKNSFNYNFAEMLEKAYNVQTLKELYMLEKSCKQIAATIIPYLKERITDHKYEEVPTWMVEQIHQAMALYDKYKDNPEFIPEIKLPPNKYMIKDVVDVAHRRYLRYMSDRNLYLMKTLDVKSVGVVNSVYDRITAANSLKDLQRLVNSLPEQVRYNERVKNLVAAKISDLETAILARVNAIPINLNSRTSIEIVREQIRDIYAETVQDYPGYETLKRFFQMKLAALNEALRSF